MSKVYILILNWNGWKDTIECLESVLRNDYSDYQVIICDNDSQDDSLGYIKEWASGRIEVSISEDIPLRSFSYPPIPKPISYVEYNREKAEAGGNEEGKKARLILIQTGANLGFAGGNNVGLRYALSRNDFDYVWLLNNDTIIKSDALMHMVRRMKEKHGAGICGSTLPYYHDPRTVWALGGATYNKWLAMPRCIGLNQPFKLTMDKQKVERRMDYIAGASMLVSRELLRDVGLMSEDYFLYFEELDWAVRSKEQYTLVYAPESIVYHKVGSSTTQKGAYNDSSMSEYFMFKNSVLFTYRYFPSALPLVLPRVSLIFLIKRLRSVLRRLLRRTD